LCILLVLFIVVKKCYVTAYYWNIVTQDMNT
jgi:hypothetical protein